MSELQEKFSKAKGVIFTDYRGLTVEEITNLRDQLRSAQLEYRVVKNTLARRAVEGTSLDNTKDYFSGPVGLAIGYDDPVLLAKKVLEFIKSNEKLKVTVGSIEGTVCEPNDLKTISELPSREVQLSMLVGAMKSPLFKLANALNATMVRFAYAMEALKRSREANG